jgi:drug/metabolite transporter (DMT)-like permease
VNRSACDPPRCSPHSCGWSSSVWRTTGGALVLFYALVHRIGAVRANLAAYLAPGFAVAYGAVFLGERVSLKALAGLILILTGSYISIRH